MVAVSNVVEGLWFLSKRESRNSLNMDRLRKVLPTNDFGFNQRRPGHHVSRYSACVCLHAASFKLKRTYQAFPLFSVIWLQCWMLKV